MTDTEQPNSPIDTPDLGPIPAKPARRRINPIALLIPLIALVLVLLGLYAYGREQVLTPTSPSIVSASFVESRADFDYVLQVVSPEAGTIVVRDGTRVITELQFIANTVTGIWLPPMSEGRHNITAELVDATGRRSQPSAPAVFAIAPAPAVTAVAASTVTAVAASTVTAVAASTATAAPTATSTPPTAPPTPTALPTQSPQVRPVVTISLIDALTKPVAGFESIVILGRAQGAEEVRFAVDQIPAGNVTLDPGGAFSVTIKPGLTDGTHIILIDALGPGNASIGSQTLTFTVKSPVQISASSAVSLSAGSSLSGLGPPGGTITVTRGTLVLGVGPIDAIGRWRITVSLPPFVPGTYEVDLIATGPTGRIGDRASARISVAGVMLPPLGADLTKP